MSDGVLKEPKLLGVLRLMYPNNTESFEKMVPCQANTEAFFADMAAQGKPYDKGVLGLVSLFAKNYPTQFEKALNLQSFLKDLTAKIR